MLSSGKYRWHSGHMGHGTPKGRGTHLGSKMCAKETKTKVECTKMIRQRYCGHLKRSRHPSCAKETGRMHENDQAAILWTPQRVTASILGRGCAKKTSQMHENDQATMKTRYCGHLYSPLLRKWTSWDHRGWVSYCMEGGLKGT
jgi:hypothetical protein